MTAIIQFDQQAQEAAAKLLAFSMRDPEHDAKWETQFREEHEGIIPPDRMDIAWQEYKEDNEQFWARTGHDNHTFEKWLKDYGRSMEEFLYASEWLTLGDHGASEEDVRSVDRNLNLLVHCLEEIRDTGKIAFETRAEATIFERADAIIQQLRRMHGNAFNRRHELDEGVAERLRQDVLGQSDADDDELTLEEVREMQKVLKQWRIESYRAEQEFGRANYPGGDILPRLRSGHPDFDPMEHHEAGADAEQLYRERWNILRELGQRFTGAMDEFTEIRRGDGLGLSSRTKNMIDFLSYLDPDQQGTSPTVQEVVRLRKAPEYTAALNTIHQTINAAKPTISLAGDADED